MLILAFDQSIKRTGWCVLETNERGKVMRDTIKFASFTAAPVKDMSTEAKCDLFADELIAVLDREHPHFVAWEAARDDVVSYPKKVQVKGNATKSRSGDMFASSQPTTKMLPATINADQLILRDIQGQVRQACKDRGLQKVKVPPKTWRANLFGQGYGNMETEKAKAHAKDYCHRAGIKVANGDEAEAVCIAIWASSCDPFRLILHRMEEAA
jgi:hypothetical protein